MGRAEPGRVIAARYRLRAVIRRDGMGDIWLAYDGMRQRDVVLRASPWVPPSDAEERESRRERLLNEARALAQLDHPNIVGVLDIAEDGGRSWIVFEAAPYRFPYRSLGDVVRDDGPLQPEQAAQVGLQVLAAVRQAHTVSVLHRDIKPGSIMLGPGRRVLLADFGMVIADGSPALMTMEAATGSPLYMAPERATGEPATPASDLWSLGAALYAAVEGRVPFEGGSAAAVIAAVVNARPDPPQRAGPLWPVISGLLRKDPQARPDADGVDWLLRRVAGEHGPAKQAPRAGATREPAGARAPGPGTRAGPPPVVAAAPAPQTKPPDAANTGSAAEIVPGFGPRDHAAAAVEPASRERWRFPHLSSQQWWAAATASGIMVAIVAAIAVALWPASSSTRGDSLAVPPGSGAWSPGQVPAGAGRRTAAPAAPNASGARRAVPPGAAVPEPAPPVSPAPRGHQSGALPPGFVRYRDPTGFSIGVPPGWHVSHQGHLVYIQDPHGARFLIIDQTSHPRPDPLADWRQQEAARIATYPGYHRIRLRAVHYAPAERAADWEFTYVDTGQLTRVLNRNILVSAHHAYALYWSTPAWAWHASYRYFRAFASTFSPAPGGT
jgi:eukaryotic-like serine/threonine-protein kinase